MNESNKCFIENGDYDKTDTVDGDNKFKGE